MTQESGSPNHRPRWQPWLQFTFTRIVLPLGTIAHAGGTVYLTGRIALRFLQSDDPANRVHRVFSFRNTSDGPIRDGLGLTFDGWFGFAWAAALTIIVALAVIGAFLPLRLLRRLSMLLLIANAALWTFNAGYMAVIADPEWYGPYAGVHLLGLVATALLAFVRFRRR